MMRSTNHRRKMFAETTDQLVPKSSDSLRPLSSSIGRSGKNFTLCSAKAVKQPGDSSCLFHSLAFGINGIMAWSARRARKRRTQVHCRLQLE
mmetsp:Transcript_40843/g.80423  ORF Transcript_40843/g.80423 Transcript_40843/m.80423 type:complete len:92 (+) Transcript_40843:11-286(+)